MRRAGASWGAALRFRPSMLRDRASAHPAVEVPAVEVPAVEVPAVEVNVICLPSSGGVRSRARDLPSRGPRLSGLPPRRGLPAQDAPPDAGVSLLRPPGARSRAYAARAAHLLEIFHAEPWRLGTDERAA